MKKLYTVLGFLFLPALLVSILVVWHLSRPLNVHVGKVADDRTQTVQAIDEFHRRMSDGRFPAIYSDAHEALRQTQSQTALIAAMRMTRQKYGRMVRVSYKKLNVIVASPIEIRAVYNTTYEKGEATEVFLFLRDGDEVRLAMYRVYPGAVKPKNP